MELELMTGPRETGVDQSEKLPRFGGPLCGAVVSLQLTMPRIVTVAVATATALKRVSDFMERPLEERVRFVVGRFPPHPSVAAGW